MLFVCYPKCSTCAKARKWLEEQEISFEERDIKTDNPTEAELRDWHRRSGLPLKRFFNTSGLQYKALGLKDRLPEMSEDEQYALLATDGMLVKRPLLIGEDFALPGFREKHGKRFRRLNGPDPGSFEARRSLRFRSTSPALWFEQQTAACCSEGSV